MDESAQQAVQLGVNITIFIVALSISITLLLGVRDVTKTALEYNASIPTGSRVVSVSDKKQRTIKGYELLSYYSKYMSNQAKITTSGKYIITIENKDGTVTIKNDTNMERTETLISFFSDKGVDLSKEYEIIPEKYDKTSGILNILIKEI